MERKKIIISDTTELIIDLDNMEFPFGIEDVGDEGCTVWLSREEMEKIIDSVLTWI